MATQQPKPAAAGKSAPKSAPKPYPASSWPWAALIVAALCSTTLVIVLVSRTGPAESDGRRVWEDANRAAIVALKSDAEALTIADQLPAAHAKYRELEKLVAGRAIQDPRLFDLVDQARIDQARVLTMILHAKDPGAVEPGLAPATLPSVGTPGTLQLPPGKALAQAALPPRRQATLAPAAAISATTPSTPTRTPTPIATTPAPASAPAGVEATITSDIVEPPPAGSSTLPQRGGAGLVAAPGGRITDAQVEQAIRRGVDFLHAQFQNGRIPLAQGPGEGRGEIDNAGLNALAVYALLSASQAIRDERLGSKGEFLTTALEQLKSAPLDPGGTLSAPVTYARSLRASALAVYNRPQDRQSLTADVKWLINAAVDGAYTYDDRYAQQIHPAAPAPPPEPRSSRDDRALEAGGQASLVRPLGLASGDASLLLMHNGESVFPSQPPPLRSLPPPPPPPAKPYPTPTYQTPAPGYRSRLGERKDYPGFTWDNSNSQYGLLGVWAGAEVGVEVPDSYWREVQAHWMYYQLPSGQWSYMPPFEPSYSMTVGGIASLLVAHDYLEAPLLGSRTAGQRPYNDFLTAGLAFLESGDNAIDIMQTAPDAKFIVGYNLFGLERVGLASGLKYFGKHDWFAELARRVVALQHPSGAWGRLGQGPDAIIDTAYVILFLSRGRHPVLMNKLKFEGLWTNRPRDVANLAGFTGREMERPINWQVVDIDKTADDWADAPILYLASNRPVTLTNRDVMNLRAFVEQGGLLFTHADLGSDTFSAFASRLAKELFPGMALENLSPQHPLYSLNYKINTPRPRLQAVDNGVRVLMVHSPTDLSNAWQVRATVSRKEAFQIGANLYLYTTGKERFRNRLDTRAIPEPPLGLAPQIDIARVQYDGDWNPEPGAWPRFARVFQNKTGTRLYLSAAKPAELDATKYLMAVLTGVTARTPAEADLAPVARFVRDGGTLVVDSCGGSGAFATAIEAWLARLDLKSELQPLRKDDPAIKQTIEGTVDLPNEQLRLYAIEKIGATGMRMKSMKFGKGRVIFTPLDATSGLLGTNTWGILGYLPEYSEAVLTNIVLSTSAAAK
ncbi:MAG: DUF4159 domain-containing protein [Tepidisphaeraceae bacterium]